MGLDSLGLYDIHGNRRAKGTPPMPPPSNDKINKALLWD